MQQHPGASAGCRRGRGVPRFAKSLLATASLALCAAASAEPGSNRSDLPNFDLSSATIPAWREHILPTDAELAWQKIGWLPTFTEGLVRADASDRPVLLWVMNGHPLGCT